MNNLRLMIVCLAVTLAGCGDGDDDDNNNPDSTIDSTVDAGVDGSGDDCFMNPQTHEEIINACTTAEKIDKEPDTDAVFPGGVPPALP